MKINDFRGTGTGADALRTFKNAYLSMVFKGARAPAGAAAAEGAPAFANANQAANGDAEGAEGESAMATENGRENYKI